MATNKITVGVEYQLNQAKFNEIMSALNKIQEMSTAKYMSINKGLQVEEASKQLDKLRPIITKVKEDLTKAFNTNIGTINISKFNQELSNSKLNINQVYRALQNYGAEGQIAFRNLNMSLATQNLQLKESHTLLDKMSQTMANTVRYGISSSIFNTLANRLQQSYEFSKQLNTSLNDIRIVTNKSADEMERFAVQANKAAQGLGKTTQDYAKASLIYFQQGLSDVETEARTRVTLKAANVTGQQPSEVSEQLTAVWNGYKVTAAETELYVDKLAKVAADTAADLEELSTGMSKVASAANLMGVDIDQLNAQMATIISVTRQAPESIGTALKTIYGRISDIKAGIDEEISLGNYTSKMAEMGVNVLDANNKLRDMGEVIDEIGNKWETMSREQQVALSKLMGGTRQYNNLLALFDNWDMYTKTLETSRNAQGTLQEQQDIYMESTEAHLQQLQSAWEKLFVSIFDAKGLNGLIDGLTTVVGLLGDFSQAVGGGANSLLTLGAIGMQVMNKQITQGIATTIGNFKAERQNKQILAQDKTDIQTMRQQIGQGKDVIDDAVLDRAYQKLEALANAYNYLSEAEINEQKNKIKQEVEIQNELTLLEQRKNAIIDFANQISGLKITDIDELRGIDGGNKQLANSFDEIQAAILGMKKAMSGFSAEQTKGNKDAKIMAEYLSEMLNKAKEFEKKGINIFKSLSPDRQKSVKTTFEKLYNKEELGELENYLTKINTLMANGANPKAADSIKELVRAFKEGTIEVDKLAEGIRRLPDEDYDGGMAKLREAAKQAGIEVDKLDSKLKDLSTAEKISDAVTGTMQLVSGFNSLANIPNILGNQDIGAWEKFTQVTMAFSSGIPMLISGFSKMKSVIFAVSPTLKVLTADELAAASAGYVLQAAFFEVIVPLLAVVGAIAALTGVVYLGIKAWNKDAEAAKDAAAAAQHLEETYNSLSEKAKELSENITKYNEAKEKLEKLDASTKEYAKTLEETNNKARELIETLKLYDSFTMKNGVIEIDPEALRNIENESKATANRAQQAMYSAKIYSNKASLTSDKTDLARAVGSGYNMRNDYFEMYSSDVDKVVAKLRTLGEEEYSSLIHNEKKFNDWLDKVFKTSDNANLKFLVLSEKIAKQADGFDKLIKKTDELAKADEYYAKQIMAGAINEKYGSELDSLSTKVRRNGEAYVDENRKSQIATILDEYSEKNAKDLEEEIKKIDARNDLWNRDLRQYSYKGEQLTVSNDEDLARTYARIVLGREDDYKDLQYEGGWGKGTLKTADGKETLTENMSDNKMRQEIVITLETERLKKEAEEILDKDNILDGMKNIISSASSFGKEYGTDFSDAMIAAMASTDKEINLSGVFNRLDPDEVAEMQGFTGEELRQKLGLTDEVVNAIGKEAAEKLLDSFSKNWDNYKWDIDDHIEASMTKIQEDLEAAGQGLSKKKLEEYAKEIKVYAKNLMEVAESSDKVADSMKYDSDTAVKFALSIVRMNKAIDTLADNIENWSDVLKNSSEISQEYAEAMYGIEEVLGDIYGIEIKYISQDFVKEHLEEIQQVAQGSEDAIESLRLELEKDLFVQILIDNKIDDQKGTILAEFLSLRDQIEASMSGLEIGDNLDDSALVEALNKIIDDTNMTVDQANQMFAALKLEPTYETETVTQKQVIPRTETKHTVKEVGVDTSSGFPLPTWTTVDEVKQLAPIESDVEIPVTAIRGDGKQPHIDGVKKAPNSSFNNYSSQNQGGKAPGKSSKSGGGSSKKNKKQEHEQKEADIYHEIDNQIKLITTDLQRLQKVQDKVFGTDAIKNLNEQYALLGKQADNYRQKMTIAEGEYDTLRKELEQAGIAFTSDGLVADYVQTMDNILAEYNKKVDEYNALSEAEKEKWDEENVLKNAKEEMEKKREKIDRIDTIKVDLMPGIKDAIKEIEREQISIKIKNFNMEVDLRLEMKDALKDWDSFRKEVLDDWDELWEKESFSEGFFDKDGKWNSNLMRTAKEDFDLLRGYFDKEFTSMSDGSTIYGSGLVGAQTEHLNELVNEAKKAFAKNTDGLFADETQTAMDNLKKYKEEAMTTARDIKQKIEDIKSLYLNTLKEANEKFKEQADMISRVGKLLEHDAKLIKLIYGEDQYESLSKYYQKQHDNNIQQLDFSKRQVDFWKNQMDLAKENSDEWKYAKQQWLSAIDQASSDLEAAVETAKEKWENAIDNVFDKLDKKFTDGLGLDYIKEEWTLINKNSDQYLDSINAAYGIQKLQNKYLDAIDKSDDIGNQRRLNELMNSQINELQQIDRLTQTDLERAELKYQIALKQMELEDAQNAKTTMRLRRDSQGNYTYQFVANEDNINKAKEELEDLKNQLYNFDLKAYRNNLDQAATAYEEYMSKMAEAAKINDPEERAAKEALIQEQYQEYITMLTDENERYRNNLIESAIDEKIELNQLEKEDFINATDEKIDKIMNDLVPQWDAGVQSMIDKWSGPDGFKETTEEAIDELMDKDQDYRDDLKEIETTAGVVFDDIKDTMNDTRIDALDPYIDRNEDLIDTYDEQVRVIRDDLLPQLGDLEDQYWDLVTAIEAANAAQGIEYSKNADEAAKTRQEIYNDLNPSNEAKPVVIAEEETSSDNSGSDASSGNGGRGVTAGQVIAGFTGKYYYDSYGTDPAGIRKSGKAVKVDNFSSVDYGGTQRTGSYALHISDAETGAHLGWVRPEDLEGYSTGGYTGEWGNNGRLALLHQKELVLNAEDTANFLNALDIMRNIVGNIGANAFARLAALGGSHNIGDLGSAMEQNVVINADFPNATDHNEIQQAFDNLMNIASQRVNRNRI